MQSTKHARRRWLACALMAAALPAALPATLPTTLPAAASPALWHAVDGATLDTLRGGFIGAHGLAVSLGVERLVSINGEVVARTSFHLTDLASLSVDQARQTSAALSGVKLIQNGSENIYRAVLADGALSGNTLGGTVIQNTLSDQQIESRTVINSSVNSLGLLKTINFNGSVSDAIMRGAGPP